MEDIRLRQHVLDELAFEPSIDASNISVTVAAGVVTLRGHVPNFAQKVLAQQAALGVKGARRVVAKAIRVAADVGGPVSDDDIARRALTVLDLNVLVPPGAIQIRVFKGQLELTGDVEWDFQRVAAIEDLRKLRGVKGIRDAIVKSPTAPAADAATCIQDAWRRRADIAATSVRVSACEGVVRLEGRVDSWASRARLEQTAWSAPGVHHVEDQVEIG